MLCSVAAAGSVLYLYSFFCINDDKNEESRHQKDLELAERRRRNTDRLMGKSRDDEDDCYKGRGEAPPKVKNNSIRELPPPREF